MNTVSEVSLGYCANIWPVISILKTVLQIIQWIIPLIIIFLGIFDLMKAVVASKEDEIKAAQKLLIKRVVYAIVIFLVPTIVFFVFNILSSTKDTNDKDLTNMDFFTCWNYNKCTKDEAGNINCQ